MPAVSVSFNYIMSRLEPYRVVQDVRDKVEACDLLWYWRVIDAQTLRDDVDDLQE